MPSSGVGQCQKSSAFLAALNLTFGVETVTSGAETSTSGVASGIEMYLWCWPENSMPDAGVEDPLGRNYFHGAVILDNLLHNKFLVGEPYHQQLGCHSNMHNSKNV